MDGDHSIERCYEVTTDTLHAVFDAAVSSSGSSSRACLLKPNMVIPGKKFAGGQASPEEVADATIACFREVVPAAVPGIVFLSGGQGDEEATANLDAINKPGPHPWQLSFSYGRALQAAGAGRVAGRRTRTSGAGQAAYLHRARMNGLAQTGAWTRRRGAGGVRERLTSRHAGTRAAGHRSAVPRRRRGRRR